MGGVVVMSCWLWPQIAKAMGIAHAEERAEAFRPLVQATMRGDISSMECLNLIAEREKLTRPTDNYWSSFFQPELHQPTVQLIHALKHHNQRVVCGTNTMDVHYQYHIDHDEYRFFDTVYASHIMQQIKPDITFWHYIKNQEQQYDFSDMFFFDDMQVNVDAAASLGIHAHVFTSAQDTADYINSLTDLHITL